MTRQEFDSKIKKLQAMVNGGTPHERETAKKLIEQLQKKYKFEDSSNANAGSKQSHQSTYPTCPTCRRPCAIDEINTTGCLRCRQSTIIREQTEFYARQESEIQRLQFEQIKLTQIVSNQKIEIDVLKDLAKTRKVSRNVFFTISIFLLIYCIMITILLVKLTK